MSVIQVMRDTSYARYKLCDTTTIFKCNECFYLQKHSTTIIIYNYYYTATESLRIKLFFIKPFSNKREHLFFLINNYLDIVNFHHIMLI